MFVQKKDLIEGVLAYMTKAWKENSSQNMAYLERNEYVATIKNYLGFQIRHRFFYRDILDINSFVPTAKSLYEKQMELAINFNKNGLYLAIGKGLIKPEPHEGHYYFLSKNITAILNSWLIEREIFGEAKVSLHQVILALGEAHYPYFTEKGLELYAEIKGLLPALIKEGNMV